MSFLKTSISIFLIYSLFSCNKQEDTIIIKPKDYHNIVDKLTEVMVHDIFSPPVASRIYAYPNIAAYEVLNQENKTYRSLSNQLNGLKRVNLIDKGGDVNKRLASIIAYLDVAKELVFSKEKITSYQDSLYTLWESRNSNELYIAKKYAEPIISHILSWMNEDNYNETQTMPEFNISSHNPSRWEPTPPAYMKGIEPNWNKIRTFVLDSASQFKPKAPPKFSLDKESKFYKELISVYNLTEKIKKKGNNSEEIAIAQFWDCNPYVSVNRGHFMFAEKKITPGAHWIGICKIACKKTKSDFEKTVFAYTKTSIVIVDAFISCWDEKYRSNLIRPETLINKYIDDSWTPLLQTPPFPEYTSGHSVVSGASAEILTEIFGDNFNFDDTTEIPYGLPIRNFSSFKSAANEAAISRVYGGIHYDSAVKIGITQGVNVGKEINSKIAFTY